MTRSLGSAARVNPLPTPVKGRRSALVPKRAGVLVRQLPVAGGQSQNTHEYVTSPPRGG